MPGFADQTGALQSGASASGNLEDFNEFPRFLGRDGAGHRANVPPPLPRAAWYVRVQWMLRRTPPRRLAAIAVAAVVLTPAATALVLASRPVHLNVIHVRSIDQPNPVDAVVSETNTEVETRLEFAANFSRANHLSQRAPANGPGFGDQIAGLLPPPAKMAEPEDAPAMLIVRNVPENVTFTAGEAMGQGQWIMPGGDLNQLDMTLGEGFDRPVSASVEIVSHAGVTLGFVQLELGRQVAAVAGVTAAAPPSEPVLRAETENTESKTQASEADAKPIKRARRAATRKNSKFARADGGYIKRVKKSDRWKTETVEAPDSAGNQSTNGAATEAPVDETAKGPISKFFSWIAGGGTSTAPGETADNPKATLFAQ